MPRKKYFASKNAKKLYFFDFFGKKLEKTDEKITLRFKIQFSISKRENTPETIPDPNPITKKTSVGRKK